ncbi:MAG: CBS domain-containing protein [Candidatus Heimdallarchaeota archaeon]|nr:CBS domain-containing protein [Candidatus Heimdallarchaeota archaeon]
MKVSEVMTRDPVALKVPGTRNELFELIKKTNQTSFPVLKAGSRKLVGIVTETDIVHNPSETQIALLMTRKPVTTSPDTEIGKVIEILLENKFRQLPVVENEELIGIVTIGDIISKVLAITSTEKTIERYMTDFVLGIWQETPVLVCQKTMEFACVESAIIFDDEAKMVGIITNVDFVKFFEAISSEQRSEMSTGEGKEGSWDAVSTLIVHRKELTLPKLPVKKMMTKEVVTTFRKATISDVAKKMRKMSFYQMPVVDAKGNVIGMIRDADLLQAYLSEI